MLSIFNVAKARDEDGVEIQIEPDAFTDGVVRQVQHQDILWCNVLNLQSAPRPFVCSIVPRSPPSESLINAAIHALYSNT